MKLKFKRGFDEYYVEHGNTLAVGDTQGNLVTNLILDAVATHKQAELAVTVVTFSNYELQANIDQYPISVHVGFMPAPNNDVLSVLTDICNEPVSVFKLHMYVIDNAPVNGYGEVDLANIKRCFERIADMSHVMILWTSDIIPKQLLVDNLWGITCLAQARKGSAITLIRDGNTVPVEDASHELVHHMTWVGQKDTEITGVRWVHKKRDSTNNEPITFKIGKCAFTNALQCGDVAVPTPANDEVLSLRYSASGNVVDIVVANKLGAGGSTIWDYSKELSLITAAIRDDRDYPSMYVRDVVAGFKPQLPTNINEYITAIQEEENS